MLHPDPKSKTPKNVKDRVAAFKQKCNAVLGQLGIPIILYAATGKDIYRKPRPGMWAEMKDDYDLADSDIDLEDSVFVGDAGGRVAELKGANTAPKDFSCSDRNLAGNIGIPFQTPEEFFLGEEPREFARDFDLANFPFVGQEGGINSGILEKANDKDIVMFVGPPGAGKSTFYWKYLKPLGYERVNQDILKRYVLPVVCMAVRKLIPNSKDKCFKAAAKLLQDGNSVVVGMCPFLAPRAASAPSLSLTDSKTIQIRIPTLVLSGSLWRASTTYPSDASGSERRCCCASTMPPYGR